MKKEEEEEEEEEDFADLTPELLVVLNEWDSLGVADLSPDEYDGLNGNTVQLGGSGGGWMGAVARHPPNYTNVILT